MQMGSQSLCQGHGHGHGLARQSMLNEISLKSHVNCSKQVEVSLCPRHHTPSKDGVMSPGRVILHAEVLTESTQLASYFLKLPHRSGSLSSLFAASTSIPSSFFPISALRRSVIVLFKPQVERRKLETTEN